MFIYVDPQGNYPRYDGDILLVQPEWAPTDEPPQGWLRVVETLSPPITESTYVYEGFPLMIEGVLTQNWVSRAFTQEELLEINETLVAVVPYLEPGVSEAVLGE